MPATSEFGSVVLCGGKSSRMGRPKHRLPFGNETMLQRVVRILRDEVGSVAVVAAPQQDVPELPEDVFVTRDEAEGMGPLGGIAAGLTAQHSRVEAVYVSSCDAPFLQPAFVRRMLELLGEHDVAIPHDGDYYHPLAAVYRTALADQARNLLAEGQRRPRMLLERCRTRVVASEELRRIDPELRSLCNTNTPEQYEAALAEAGLRRTRGE